MNSDGLITRLTTTRHHLIETPSHSPFRIKWQQFFLCIPFYIHILQFFQTPWHHLLWWERENYLLIFWRDTGKEHEIFLTTQSVDRQNNSSLKECCQHVIPRIVLEVARNTLMNYSIGIVSKHVPSMNIKGNRIKSKKTNETNHKAPLPLIIFSSTLLSCCYLPLHPSFTHSKHTL